MFLESSYNHDKGNCVDYAEFPCDQLNTSTGSGRSYNGTDEYCSHSASRSVRLDGLFPAFRPALTSWEWVSREKIVGSQSISA